MLHRRLIRLIAASIAALALLAPSAMARSDYPVSPVSSSSSSDGPPVVVEADESSGFDWGSAAIGAGVAAGIVLLAGATATTTVRHRRTAAH